VVAKPKTENQSHGLNSEITSLPFVPDNFGLRVPLEQTVHLRIVTLAVVDNKTDI